MPFPPRAKTVLISKNEKAFKRFHKDNPEVYDLILEYARAAKASGRKRYSMRAIFHLIRWHINVETKSRDEFKISNNHSSHYARMLIRDYPEFDGFFILK